jgi:hypothetical protein
MLNRNDRTDLRRNRNAVSWLCVLCIILFVWIKVIYGDINTYSTNNNEIRFNLEETQKLCIDRKKTIDSLLSVINYKPVDTPKLVVVKPYKPVKKDSLVTKDKAKIDSSKVEIILKDTLE